MYGGTGIDTLIGQDGEDSLFGEYGDDTLTGGDVAHHPTGGQRRAETVDRVGPYPSRSVVRRANGIVRNE